MSFAIYLAVVNVTRLASCLYQFGGIKWPGYVTHILNYMEGCLLQITLLHEVLMSKSHSGQVICDVGGEISCIMALMVCNIRLFVVLSVQPFDPPSGYARAIRLFDSTIWVFLPEIKPFTSTKRSLY